MGEIQAKEVTHYKSMAGAIMLAEWKTGNDLGTELGTGGDKSKRWGWWSVRYSDHIVIWRPYYRFCILF